MFTVIGTTTLVVVALMGMDFFIQLVNQFNDLGKGEYGLSEAFIYVLFGLPKDLYQLFPMAGLIGCLLGLGLLASHSELIVMRASTLSVAQISAAVMLAIFCMVFLMTLLGEVVAPSATYYADTLKTQAKSGGQAVSTARGIWLREGRYFVHINVVKKDGTLLGVTTYKFDENNQLVQTSLAKVAKYKKNEWYLNGVVHSYISKDIIKTKEVRSEKWDLNLNPSLLQLSEVEPEEMSLKKLYSVMSYKKDNALEYADYALPFWQRIFKPLSTCVMMFLAIPFIFGPLRSVTMGLRLVTGIVVGFAFYILNQFFGPLTLVYQIPPLFAAVFPILIFAILGYFLMLKVK